MTKEQRQVREFHEAFDLVVNDEPTTDLPLGTIQLRYDLIKEELDEYWDAAVHGDVVGVADALADILYVTLGAAVTHGIDLEPVFEAVHVSNMAKVGGQKRADGKMMKPKGWTAPDLAPILKAQGA